MAFSDTSRPISATSGGQIMGSGTNGWTYQPATHGTMDSQGDEQPGYWWNQQGQKWGGDENTPPPVASLTNLGRVQEGSLNGYMQQGSDGKYYLDGNPTPLTSYDVNGQKIPVNKYHVDSMLGSTGVADAQSVASGKRSDMTALALFGGLAGAGALGMIPGTTSAFGAGAGAAAPVVATSEYTAPTAVGGFFDGGGIGAEGFGGGVYGAMEGTGAAMPGIMGGGAGVVADGAGGMGTSGFDPEALSGYGPTAAGVGGTAALSSAGGGGEDKIGSDWASGEATGPTGGMLPTDANGMTLPNVQAGSGVNGSVNGPDGNWLDNIFGPGTSNSGVGDALTKLLGGSNGLFGNVLGAGANYAAYNSLADKYIQAAKDLQKSGNPLNDPQRQEYQQQLSKLEANPADFWQTNPVAKGQLNLANNQFQANSAKMGTGGTQFSDYLKNVMDVSGKTFNDQATLLGGLGGFNLPAQGTTASANLTSQGLANQGAAFQGIGNLFGSNIMSPANNKMANDSTNPVSGSTNIFS